MESIFIKNELGKYSKWDVYDYDSERDCYHIELSTDKAVISSIGKSKIIEKDGKYYSEIEKPIEEKFDIAFTSFRTIKF